MSVSIRIFSENDAKEQKQLLSFSLPYMPHYNIGSLLFLETKARIHEPNSRFASIYKSEPMKKYRIKDVHYSITEIVKQPQYGSLPEVTIEQVIEVYVAERTT
jgi:hypothetical protein